MILRERYIHFFERLTQWLFITFLFVLPWQTIWIVSEGILNGAKWEYGTVGLYASEGVLWLAFLSFMVWYVLSWQSQNTRRPWQFSRDRLYVFLSLCFVVYVWSTQFWASSSLIASFQSLHVLEAVLCFLLLQHAPGKTSSYVKAFVAGMTVQSVLGIWQWLTQSTVSSVVLGLVSHLVWQAGTSIIDGVNGARWLRAYGVFPHPNVFGGFLVASICGIVYLYHRETQVRYRVLYHGVFLLHLAALFFTFSRSAWIAGACAVVWYVWSGIKRNIRSFFPLVASAVFLFSILSAVYLPLIYNRWTGTTQHEVQSVSERVNGYREAAALWRTHPWAGVGAGNYTAALFEMNSSYPGWAYQPVHNGLVLGVVEWGLIGLVLSVFVMFSAIRYGVSRAKQASTYYYVIIAVGSVYGILLFLDHYLISSYGGLLLGAVWWGLTTRIGCKVD